MKAINIEYVTPLETTNVKNDNIDVWVTLDDGKIYSFLIATPENIYWCMQNESIDYYFGVPVLFVNELTRGNIERAINAIVEENNGKWINVYGTLQTRPQI
ncbi:MAG: hypothetical protein JNN15_12520 [Blastocatellia bacterium]|nr:hypothetical protein [Blastocatellia bacterium]